MSRSRTFTISIKNSIESDWNNICNFVKDGKAEYIVTSNDNNIINGFIRFNSAKTISAVIKMFVNITTVKIDVNNDLYYKNLFNKHQFFYEDGAPAQNNKKSPTNTKVNKKHFYSDVLSLENKEKIADLENLVKDIKDIQANQLDCIIYLMDDSKNNKKRS